jgi:hypothetical protein
MLGLARDAVDMGVMTLRRMWFDSTPDTSLNVMEVPVATKRYGGRWEHKERNYRP